MDILFILVRYRCELEMLFYQKTFVHITLKIFIYLRMIK